MSQTEARDGIDAKPSRQGRGLTRHRDGPRRPWQQGRADQRQSGREPRPLPATENIQADLRCERLRQTAEYRRLRTAMRRLWRCGMPWRLRVSHRPRMHLIPSATSRSRVLSRSKGLKSLDQGRWTEIRREAAFDKAQDTRRSNACSCSLKNCRPRDRCLTGGSIIRP
jgi:hypothetical protein